MSKTLGRFRLDYWPRGCSPIECSPCTASAVGLRRGRHCSRAWRRPWQGLIRLILLTVMCRAYSSCSAQLLRSKTSRHGNFWQGRAGVPHDEPQVVAIAERSEGFHMLLWVILEMCSASSSAASFSPSNTFSIKTIALSTYCWIHPAFLAATHK